MPGKLKVHIVAARNLPVMDRASDLTDAFVEVKFCGTTYKTDVCRKSLNPQWNSEWYRFEIDDEDLQDEPLQIRVLDYDTYSAHDAIGKVYIQLSPLLSKDNATVINGWFPIYDTMHGIRGELNVVVKVDLFYDLNKFRQSSCGVHFYCSSGIPYGYRIQGIQGFVEELVVNDDPEYQWIDKIRSMRASNEARQIQFSKLSGQLQRKIGLKVLEIGGNSVIGYRQCFDLEGESGIVVRAIGTSVTLLKLTQLASPPHSSSPTRDALVMTGAADVGQDVCRSYAPYPSPSPSSFPHTLWMSSSPGGFPLHHSPQGLSLPSRGSVRRGSFSSVLPLRRYSTDYSVPMPEDVLGSPPNMTPTRLSSSPVKAVPLVRRSSESDIGTPPRAGSIGGSSGSGSGGARGHFTKPVIPQQNIEILEYPFFTIHSFPPGFLVHLGGVVSARSVKLLDRIHNPDAPETRDAWWTEIRMEIRSHTKAMGCHAVVGYSEHTTICDEIIILSATGTAAQVHLQMASTLLTSTALQQNLLTLSLDRQTFEKDKDMKDKKLHVDVNLANQMAGTRYHNLSDGADPIEADLVPQCSLCHIPYKEKALPFPVHLASCMMCGRKKVPDVLFTTIEPPSEICIIGKGCLIQSRICRAKREAKGEANAKEVSDSLPFMEYELHNQLINKLKVKGMNTLFGLKVQVSVGEKLLVAVATATAVYCGALPGPPLPKILGKVDGGLTDSSLMDMQRKVLDTINKNKEIYNLHPVENLNGEPSPRSQLTDDSEDELSFNEMELSSGNKDTFVLEIDDAEDAQLVSVLLDPPVPEGFDMCNTDIMAGVPNMACNLQMFTRVWRGQMITANNKALSNIFDHIMRSLFFKMRTLVPCCLGHLNFDIDLPEDDEIQISVTGVCMGEGEPMYIGSGLMDVVCDAKSDTQKQSNLSACEGDDMMFHMEMVAETQQCVVVKSNKVSPQIQQSMKTKKMKYHNTLVNRHGIELTPMPYVPGSRIVQYLGHLNFFIIRETTSVREEGGLNGFMHSFLAEVLTICRAHVGALGGNALVSYRMTECVLENNLHKNQSQCLINVCGDVVKLQYEGEQQPLNTPASSSSGKGSSGGISPLVTDQKPAKKSTPKSSPRNSPKVSQNQA